MKLEDISEIFIGVLTSREIKDLGRYKYNIFNLKNYDLQEEYEIVKTEKPLEDKLTKKGDLLIKLIYPNRIIYIDNKLENLLVPSQMCVIRTDKKKMDSRFLKWYLENDIGKEKILSEITGSSIQKISVASLKKIDVPVLDLEKQKTITDLINLWNKEKDVLQDIIKEKENLYNNLITEIIEKEGLY